MARLQILELPEGAGDDRAPFVLVVDESSHPTVEAYQAAEGWWQQLARQIGARGCVVTDDTIVIPANDVPLDENGQPLFLKVHAEGEFEKFREQVQDEIRTAQDQILDRRDAAMDAQRLVDERTDIARDMDRLTHRREELADALGLSPNRNWDDIRDTAAGLRAEAERLRAGEEPHADKSITPTPAQWIWHWNQATPAKRLSMAAQILDGMARSNNCLMADHEAMIEALRAEVAQLHDGPAKTDA